MSNYNSVVFVRPGDRPNSTAEIPAAVQVCVTSNGGVSSLQRAEDMDDALALAARARITEHHTLCVEVDAQRVLRWDRDQIVGENHWRRVDPDDMETLGPIREIHRAKGHAGSR
ncbi:hypothetical protein ParKJ_22875 [Paraburkholderia fungorum]|uniref:Plasmid conjugative transfer protein PilI domain-containing protein n=1 Tax=Paraburkholderia fungorum TaxID=134537 RepID=A0AAP5QDK2_9BURK|nr:hypothetical protein [Paraburkholderia fungorum]MDT8840272.1 hypothetical protein [Paraburkholderia fungorum]